VKGHFKRLLRINIAPIPIVLSTDIPTQMEPSSITEKCKVLGQEHRHVLPAKTSCKNAFFSRNHILQLFEPVLFYTAVDVSF
jgi:hypothetical protein